MDATGGRTYDGRTAGERRAERRERLLDAGLELFGTRGFAATSIKAVCDRARTTQRYFYEAFATKEDLLEAVYDRVVAEIAEQTMAAVRAHPDDAVARARAGVGTFVRALADDRRKARVQLFEVVGVSDRLERRRHEVMRFYARFVAESSLELAPRGATILGDSQLLALGVVGAMNELVVAWMDGGVDVPLEHLVDQCTTLVLATARAGLEDTEAWARGLSDAGPRPARRRGARGR